MIAPREMQTPNIGSMRAKSDLYWCSANLWRYRVIRQKVEESVALRVEEKSSTKHGHAESLLI